MHNPFNISIEVKDGHSTLKLALTPDALGLRLKYRALLLHCPVVLAPAWFDLGSGMDLIQTVPCFGPPPLLLTLTCFGVRPDNTFELVYRNWGDPKRDGLPR